MDKRRGTSPVVVAVAATASVAVLLNEKLLPTVGTSHHSKRLLVDACELVALAAENFTLLENERGPVANNSQMRVHDRLHTISQL